MVASNFIVYIFHYVIARFVYDEARTLGISPVLLVTLAVIALVSLWFWRHVIKDAR